MMSLTLPPEQKPFPVPLNTTTFTLLSLANSAMILSKSP
jgi:hypothetical protein